MNLVLRVDTMKSCLTPNASPVGRQETMLSTFGTVRPHTLRSSKQGAICVMGPLKHGDPCRWGRRSRKLTYTYAQLILRWSAALMPHTKQINMATAAEGDLGVQFLWEVTRVIEQLMGLWHKWC